MIMTAAGEVEDTQERMTATGTGEEEEDSQEEDTHGTMITTGKEEDNKEDTQEEDTDGKGRMTSAGEVAKLILISKTKMMSKRICLFVGMI